MRRRLFDRSDPKRPLPLALAIAAALAILLAPDAARAADERAKHDAAASRSRDGAESIQINRPVHGPEPPAAGSLPSPLTLPATDRDVWKTVQTVALFGLISLAPMGLLMVTAFVRINIVLILLRQALGSPQVPGNQVLTALCALAHGARDAADRREGLSRCGRALHRNKSSTLPPGLDGRHPADQGVHGRPDQANQS